MADFVNKQDRKLDVLRKVKRVYQNATAHNHVSALKNIASNWTSLDTLCGSGLVEDAIRTCGTFKDAEFRKA